MRNVMDKLSIRNTDYFASVGEFNDLFLARMTKSTQGMVCVGSVNKKVFPDLRNIRVLDTEKQLDDGAFDKILAEYNDWLSLEDLIRASDHMGMVLVVNIPKNILDDPKIIGGRLALFKKFRDRGIFEVWFLRSSRKGYFDLLFKVRKYE